MVLLHEVATIVVYYFKSLPEVILSVLPFVYFRESLQRKLLEGMLIFHCLCLIDHVALQLPRSAPPTLTKRNTK